MKNYVRKEIDGDGNVFYYNEKEEWHRTDGPAVEGVHGDKKWHINNKLHRIDGPAYQSNDSSYDRWYVDSVQIYQSQINKLQNLRKTINDDDLLNELLLSGRIIL